MHSILNTFIVSTSGQQKTLFFNSPPYLNMSIIGNNTCIAIGHNLPLSVSKSNVSPTLCPL